jgi:hypothetical protein
VNKFTIIPADSFIWNKLDLLKFLIGNQKQNIFISTNEEGCCLKSIGLYEILDLFEFKSVTIETNNILETHDRYNIVGSKFFKFFQTTSTYTEYHYWNKEKIFGAFYNRPIWHRIGLASELTHEYNDNSLINFRANPHDDDARQFFELQRLFEVAPESGKKFFQVADKFPVQLESTDGYTLGATTKQHTDQLCHFYPNIFVDIVAETFVNGETFFATEKTIRPMLLKKPFIIMGPKNFLIHLRQLGFKTFYEFWNEDYDGFDNRFRRQANFKYQKILQVIEFLNSKSKNELEDMYNSMQHILDHNHNLLITQTYNKNITHVK